MTTPDRGFIGRAAEQRSLLPFAALVAWFLAIWGLLRLFGHLRTIVFVTFFAIVLATVLDYPISLLARRMPRWLAMVLTLLVLAGLGALLGSVVVPMFVEQAKSLGERLPAALDKADSFWRRVGGGGLLEQARGQLGKIVSQAVPVVVAIGAGITNAVVALVLALFIAYCPREYVRGFLRLIPRGREEGVEATLRAAIESMRKWMLGVLMSMTAIGVLTGVGLLIAGIDLWLALGVLAFFGEFIPYIGPFLSALPAVAVGLVDSPATAGKVVAVYVVIQQLEGNAIQPLAMRWAVRIRPATLLVWQLAMTAAFGLGGLLVATPLLAALQGAVERGYIQRTLGKE